MFNSLKSYIEEEPSLEIQEAITDVEFLCIEKQDMERLAKESRQFFLYKIHEIIQRDRENRML